MKRKGILRPDGEFPCPTIEASLLRLAAGIASLTLVPKASPTLWVCSATRLVLRQRILVIPTQSSANSSQGNIDRNHFLQHFLVYIFRFSGLPMEDAMHRGTKLEARVKRHQDVQDAAAETFLKSQEVHSMATLERTVDAL